MPDPAVDAVSNRKVGEGSGVYVYFGTNPYRIGV